MTKPLRTSRVSGCVGKTSYSTFTGASKAARFSRRRRARRVIVYACPWCAGYHVGNDLRPRERRPRAPEWIEDDASVTRLTQQNIRARMNRLLRPSGVYRRGMRQECD